jgi:uncharacterized protein (TIGR03437 family)
VAGNNDFRVSSPNQVARRGEILHIYATGRGAVMPPHSMMASSLMTSRCPWTC